MHREERDIKSLWAAIADREARLLALVKASAQIVWVTDKDGNVLSDAEPPPEIAELTWSAFTGLSQQSLQGSGWLTALHPDDLQGVAATIRRARMTGAPIDTEFRVRHRSGEWRSMICRGSAVVTDTGQVIGWIGTCTDVSAVRRTEAAYRESQQRLEAAEESLRQAQKMQALGTLAGGIAHDFNNLLLAISGNVQLAMSDLEESHPARAALVEIAKASARASDLVRRILTFSARQPAAAAITPLQPAVEEIMTLLRSSVPPNVRLHLQLGSEAVACTLGEAELHQVIANLVNNGIQALAGRDGSVEIDVASEITSEHDASGLPHGVAPGKRYALVVIRDSGCGMDAATRSRIFEPFFTTKPTGKGIGLGLAVVHGIVQSCGGAIEVASELGVGTKVTLWLPLAAHNAVVQQPATHAKTALGRGEHILYVDDDEAINFLIQRLLTKAGYRVTGCDDPTEARRLFAAQANDFDVVVTDLAMPAMNGFDLIQQLRAVRADVPIIMTSGYVRESDQELASSLGIGRIILKPDTIDELGREVAARCTQLRLRRAQNS